MLQLLDSGYTSYGVWHRIVPQYVEIQPIKQDKCEQLENNNGNKTVIKMKKGLQNDALSAIMT